MADIAFTRVHNLGMKAAHAAADKMAAELGKRFGLRGDWKGDVLHFERPGVHGTLAVTAKDLDLKVTLGFLLRAMKGPIERAVADELDRLFPAAAKPKKAAARPKKGD